MKPLLILIPLLAGCTTTKIKTAAGATMERTSFLANQQAQEVDLDKGTLKGYTSEQAQAAGAIAEGLMRGMAK